MLWLAAIGGCLGAIILWQLAVVAALRLFGMELPFSLAFRTHPQRENVLLAAFAGSRKDTFILISGFLLFACPWFLGLTVFDFIVKRSAGYPSYGLNYIVGSIVVLLLMIVCGIWTSASSWNKYYNDPSRS
jgi:hypothetical protein